METRNHNVLGRQHAMAGPLDPPAGYPMGPPGGQAYASGGPMHPGAAAAAMHGQPAPGAVMQHAQQQQHYGGPMHQHHQMQAAQMKMQSMMGYDGGGGGMPGGPGPGGASYGHYGGRMQGDYSRMPNPAMYKQNMMMHGPQQQQQHPAAGNFSPPNHMYMQRAGMPQAMVNRSMQGHSDAQMGGGGMGRYQHQFSTQHPQQRAMMAGSGMGNMVPQNPAPGSMMPHNHMHRPGVSPQQHMQMMSQQNMHQHQQYPGTNNHNTGLMGLNSQYIGSPPPSHSHLMSPPHQAVMAQKQQQQQQYGSMNLMSPTSQQGAQQAMNYPQQVGAMGPGMMNQAQQQMMAASSAPNKAAVPASQLPDFRTFASMGQPVAGQPPQARMTMHGHARRASTPHMMSPPPSQMQMPSPGHMVSPKMYANTPPMTSPVSSIHSLQSPPPLSHPSAAIVSKSVTSSPTSSQGNNTFVTSSNVSNMNNPHQSYHSHLQQQQQMMQQLHQMQQQQQHQQKQHELQHQNMPPYPGSCMPHPSNMAAIAVSLPPSLPGTSSSLSTIASQSPVASTTASYVPTSSSPRTTSSITMTTSCSETQTGILTTVVTCHSTVVSCHSTPLMSVQGSHLKQETCDKQPGKNPGDKHVVKTTVESICVPFGWRRVVEAGTVVYYSPSGVRLGSVQHIQQYLQSEGTCKCGLECPLHVDKTFNFNPQVTSRPWRVPEDHMTLSGDLTKLCNHKRKILAMATLQNSTIQKKVDDQHGKRPSGTSPEGGKRPLSPGSAEKEKACKRHAKNQGEEVIYENPLMAQLMLERKAEGRHLPNNNAGHSFMYHNHMENKSDGVTNPLHKMEMLVDGAMQQEQIDAMMNGPHFGHPMQDGHQVGPHHHMGHPAYAMKMQPQQPGGSLPMHPQGFKMNHEHAGGMPPGYTGQMNPHHRHPHMAAAHMMQNVQNPRGDEMYPNPMMGRMPGPLGGRPLPSPGQMNSPHDQVNWTCPSDPRKKRPRAKRKAQQQPVAKGTSIWERLSPCPNVDIRTLAKDGKLPSLDNPRSFMEYQAEMMAHSFGQGGFEDNELHLRPSRTSSAGSGKSMPMDKSTPLQSPRPSSCQLSPGSTRSTPKLSARSTPVSSIMASLTNAGAISRSDQLHNSLPFYGSIGTERDKPHISINTNLPEGAVNSIFSAVVSPKAKQLPSPSPSKSRTVHGVSEGRSSVTTTISEPMRSSFVQSLFGQKCHTNTNFPASSLLSAAARAQSTNPDKDSVFDDRENKVIVNGLVSRENSPELSKTSDVTMTVTNPGDMNLSTLTMMDGLGGGFPVDQSEFTVESTDTAVSSGASEAPAAAAAVNAVNTANMANTKTNGPKKRSEQTPIQMVQNMITGLEATQNAIAACLASANAEEEEKLEKSKQQKTVSGPQDLRMSSCSSVDSTSTMSSTAALAVESGLLAIQSSAQPLGDNLETVETSAVSNEMAENESVGIEDLAEPLSLAKSDNNESITAQVISMEDIASEVLLSSQDDAVGKTSEEEEPAVAAVGEAESDKMGQDVSEPSADKSEVVDEIAQDKTKDMAGETSSSETNQTSNESDDTNNSALITATSPVVEERTSDTPKSTVSSGSAQLTEKTSSAVLEEDQDTGDSSTGAETANYPVSLEDPTTATLVSTAVVSLPISAEALSSTVSSMPGILPGVTMPTTLLPQLPVLQMEGSFSVPTLMFSPPLTGVVNPVTSPPPANQMGANRSTMLTSIFQPSLPVLQNLMHSSQGNLNQVLSQLQINSMCQGQMFQQISAQMETDNPEQPDVQTEANGEKKESEKKKGKSRKRERRKSSTGAASVLPSQQTGDGPDTAKEAYPQLPSPVDPSQWNLSAEQIAALTMNMNLIQMMTLNPSVALDPNFVQTFQQTLHTLQTQAMQHPQSALHMLQAMNYMQQHLSPFLGAAGNFAMLQQQNAAFLQQFSGSHEPGEVLAPVIAQLAAANTLQSDVLDAAAEDSKASDETMSMSSGSKSPGVAAGLNDSFNSSGSASSRGHSPRLEGHSKSPRKSDGSTASTGSKNHPSSHSSPRRQRSPRSEQHSPRVASSEIPETHMTQVVADSESIPNPANLTEAVTSVVRAEKLNVFGEFLDQDSNDPNNQGLGTNTKTYQSRLKTTDTSRSVSVPCTSLPSSSLASETSSAAASSVTSSHTSAESSNIPTTSSTTTCTSSSTASPTTSTAESSAVSETTLSSISQIPTSVSPGAKSKHKDNKKSKKSSPQKTSDITKTEESEISDPTPSETVDSAETDRKEEESSALHSTELSNEMLNTPDSQDSQATECCDPTIEQGLSPKETPVEVADATQSVTDENTDVASLNPDNDAESEKALSSESQSDDISEQPGDNSQPEPSEVQTYNMDESVPNLTRGSEDKYPDLPEDLSMKESPKENHSPGEMAETTSPTSSPPVKRTRWSYKVTASTQNVSEKSEVAEESETNNLEQEDTEDKTEVEEQKEKVKSVEENMEPVNSKTLEILPAIRKNSEKSLEKLSEKLLEKSTDIVVPKHLTTSKPTGIDKVINSVMEASAAAASMASKEGNALKSPPSKFVTNVLHKTSPPAVKTKVVDSTTPAKGSTPTSKVVSTSRPAVSHKRPGEPLNGIVSRLKRNAEKSAVAKKANDTTKTVNNKDGQKSPKDGVVKDGVKRVIDGNDVVNDGLKTLKDGLKDQANEVTPKEESPSDNAKKGPTDVNDKPNKDSPTKETSPKVNKTHTEANNKDANANKETKEGKGTSRVLNCISTNKQTSGNLKKRLDKDLVVTSEDKVITKTVESEMTSITEGQMRGIKRLMDDEEPECSHGETTDDDANSIDESTEERTPRHFEIGDLVWGPLRGFPQWPGKLVHETEVRGSPKSEDGKVWVRWFGEHSFTQVEPEQLKTLTEGLDAHHNARQNHRKGRKIQPALEVAIMEAMNELDKPTEVSSQNENKAASSALKTSPVVKPTAIIKTSPPSNRVPTATVVQDDKNANMNKTPKSAKKRRTR